MALEQIFARILADARQEAENTINNALKEESLIIQEIEKEAHLFKDNMISHAASEAEFAYKKEVIAKRLEAQKEILQAKISQIDSCFQQALKVLLTLEAPLYREFISNMLSAILIQEEAEVIFSYDDKSRISQDYIHKINPHLKLSFADNFRGGFILKTKDLLIDNSLGNILASLRQYLEPKVAQILF